MHTYEKLLISRYAPSLVLVNQAMEVVYTHGQFAGLLTLPEGTRQPDLPVGVPAHLHPSIHNGIREIRLGSERFVCRNIGFAGRTGSIPLNLVFTPLRGTGGEPLVLIEIIESQTDATPRVPAAFAPQTLPDERQEDPEYPLQHTEHLVQSTAAKPGTADQDLQLSSGEEMLGAREGNIAALKEAYDSLLRLNDQLRRRNEALERTQQNWQNLVHNIPDSIVRYDRNLVVTFVNEGFVRETGVAAAQVVGKSAFKISLGLNRDDRWPRTLERVLQTGSPAEISLSYATPRGEQHYHSIVVPEPSADGREVESVLTISHNVTALKQYERQLQQSEQLWRGLVDNTPDVISRYDRSLHLVFVNKAAEREFGVPAGALLGKNPFQFSVRTAGTQAFVDKLEAAFRTGQMQHHISEAETQEGKKYFLSTIVPEWGEEAAPETVLLISRNITDLKHTENELRQTEALIRQQNQELQKANEYLDNFVYAAAHDLRAPVANLTILTKMLLELHLDGKAEEYAAVMLTTVRRLDQTLRGLVEVLEVQSSFQANVKWVPFEQALEEVKIEMASQLNAASAQVEGDFEACPGIIYIPAYVTSIFRNLIGNAVKYRAEERPPVISVAASRQQSQVLLEFRDNGMGIDLKRLGHKLFKPFSRLTTQAEGKGIGLHLVRSMIEKNGGRIEVESVVNGGTRFRCYLHEYQLPEQENAAFNQ